MLKRFCASLAIALLIFSVSLVPASADVFATSSTEYVMDLYIGGIDQDPAFTSLPVHVNGNGQSYIIEARTSSVSSYPLKFVSNLYEPKDYDRTLIVSAGLMSTGDAWFNGVDSYLNKPSVYYNDSRNIGQSTVLEYTDAVQYANDVYKILTTHGEIFNFQVTVPAYSNAFRFDTSGYVVFSADASWTISSFGAYIIDTADDALLNAINEILNNTESIDMNIATMVTAINDILAQLRAIGADTATMVEILTNLEDLSDRQLSQLELIANNTEAIYFFLTEALKTESDEMKQAASDATSKIENNSSAEAYYQASMQGSYDKLDLENFDLTFMDSSLELIASIFGDMWLAFGQWKIVFTFPLFLGVALLVIGRISRTGGGNSSRNSEHKGGEGGA